jgi:DNA-binding transcriptional MerR regulator
MNEPAIAESYSLLIISAAERGPATYSLEDAARLSNVHPELLRYYCRLGLLGEGRAQPGVEPVFDDDALCELRRFEHYRRHHRVDRQTLRLICSLQREVERLRAELRFRRGP